MASDRPVVIPITLDASSAQAKLKETEKDFEGFAAKAAAGLTQIAKGFARKIGSELAQLGYKAAAAAATGTGLNNNILNAGVQTQQAVSSRLATVAAAAGGTLTPEQLEALGKAFAQIEARKVQGTLDAEQAAMSATVLAEIAAILTQIRDGGSGTTRPPTAPNGGR
jgi:hypothetical protein